MNRHLGSEDKIYSKENCIDTYIYQNRGINAQFSLAYLLVQMNTHVRTFLCFNAAKPVADPWYLQQTGKKLVKVR